MSRFTIPLCRPVRMTLAGLAALALPAALRAQTTPTPPKVFFACYVPSSGTAYRIKEADLKQQCAKSTHVQFSWTDGTGAFRETMVVSSGATTVEANVPAGNLVEAVATCPPDWVATGGGFWIVQGDSMFVVNYNAPSISDPQRSWRVAGMRTQATLLLLIAKAYCAR